MAHDEAARNEPSGRWESPGKEKSKGKNKTAAKENAITGLQAGLPWANAEVCTRSAQKTRKQQQIIA
jgi:hypothetical protein